MNEKNLIDIETHKVVNGVTFQFGVELLEDNTSNVYSLAYSKDHDAKLKKHFKEMDDAIVYYHQIISSENFDEMSEFAKWLAFNKHEGQKDRGGFDYINHPLAVGNRFDDPILRTIGYLHDIVEDTDTTLEFLSYYFSKEIVSAIDAISRRKSDDYKESDDDYFVRVKSNKLATKVKIQDLIHNMDIKRLNKLEPSIEDTERVIKYSLRLKELLLFENENN